MALIKRLPFGDMIIQNGGSHSAGYLWVRFRLEELGGRRHAAKPEHKLILIRASVNMITQPQKVSSPTPNLAVDTTLSFPFDKGCSVSTTATGHTKALLMISQHG